MLIALAPDDCAAAVKLPPLLTVIVPAPPDWLPRSTVELPVLTTALALIDSDPPPLSPTANWSPAAAVMFQTVFVPVTVTDAWAGPLALMSTAGPPWL